MQDGHSMTVNTEFHVTKISEVHYHSSANFHGILLRHCKNLEII